jgi:hypothetical protein
MYPMLRLRNRLKDIGGAGGVDFFEAEVFIGMLEKRVSA